MSFSVNTNGGALRALQNLNTAGGLLDRTQSRINTGLKVSSAKDNAAVYSIAQKMRGDIAGYNAVNQSLNRAISETDVALAASEAVSDLLIQMRELAVAGKDDGLDASSRTSLNDRFVQLRDQITSIVENASFNGSNLLDGTNGLVALTDASGDTTITAAANDITLSGLSLDGTNLITIPSSSVAGTVVSVAGASLDATSDSEFRAALVKLQTDNGGTLGGETINATTGVTTNVVGAGLSDEFGVGILAALGEPTDLAGLQAHFVSYSIDGVGYSADFAATSDIYLVRDGANSYLTVGNPAGGTGSAATSEASVAAVTAIDAAITSVNGVLSDLGSTANRLETQKTFASALADTLSVGVGNLVDADMAKEAANLQVFQTRQQLGLQALSIANQAPQSVLSLFR